MDYKEMDTTDFEYLSTLVGKEYINTIKGIEPDFAHDELGTIEHYPEVHIYVKEKKQVSEIMKYANSNRIPVTVRGSGTGLVGACVPIYGGILLDTSKMNKILELDEINMTLTVQPGVLLLDIYSFVEAVQLFYGPDPGEKSATIGGNISTNAGGMRAVKYGVTRDWIRGLEFVLPNGELVKTGGKVVKNASGYSIKDLIIGSEGTLGIIVEAILKLIPLPKFSVSLLIPFLNRSDAINAVPNVIASQSIPTAIEFLDHKSLAYGEEFLGKKIPNANYDSYLLVSIDGNSKIHIDDEIEKISQTLVKDCKAIDVFLIDTDERKSSVWSTRGSLLEAIKASTTLIDECDVVLPRKEINGYLAFIEELADELNVRIPYFGHVGDGNLHIYFCKDDLLADDWQNLLHKGFEKMYQKAFSLGGLVSGEHGIGYAKKTYLLAQVGQEQINLMKGIKQVFDPYNILNPGKVF